MNSMSGNMLGSVEDVREPGKNRLITVLRPTPSRFCIEHFLSTSKSTGNCHHGMHISSDSRGQSPSISSRGSHSEYDIWRSWEDCLWFQHTLEEEYERAAREKRRRLAQGKGVKGFNGLYKKDLASSWDSLPSGPDHRSIAQDIHEHLPMLTRKGTLFRASKVTIGRRQAELIAFIRALFSDDMPALIQEIRVSSIVSDFFGLWKSDFDFAEESQTLTVQRLTTSVFSSYFSASHPSLPSSDTAPRNSPSKVYNKSHRSTTPPPLSVTSSAENFEEPRYPRGSSRRSRSRPLSSSSDSSALSGSSSDTSSSLSSGPGIADSVPIVFGHNPSGQFKSILKVLPEEHGILPNPPEPFIEVKARPRVSATERKANRSYSIFGVPLQKSLLPSERSGNRSVRESWQSADSQDSTVNDLLDGLGLVLPHPIKEQKFRASIASISTFMTTDSADAVIPQTPRGSSQQRPFMLSSRISTSLSLSDFEIYSDLDGIHSIPDTFPRPVSSISESPEDRDTLEVDDWPLPASPSSTRTVFNCPPSPTYTSISSSAFSTTSTLPADDSICIKVIHNSCIILLRVPRWIRFAEFRQRLYDKFIGQEGIPLPPTYNIVFVPPNPLPACSVTSANRLDVQVITLDSDWEYLMSTVQRDKITLRIQDISNI